PQKKAHAARLMLTSGSACAFPQLQTLSSARNRTIIRHTMSIHLVEGGLAMIAGQSCIAGLSVVFPSGSVRFLCGLHLPFSKRGNKKAPVSAVYGGARQRMPARYERIHTACIRSITGVYSGVAHVPVKQLI